MKAILPVDNNLEGEKAAVLSGQSAEVHKLSAEPTPVAELRRDALQHVLDAVELLRHGLVVDLNAPALILRKVRGLRQSSTLVGDHTELL